MNEKSKHDPNNDANPLRGLTLKEGFEPGDLDRYTDREGIAHPDKASVIADDLGFCGCGDVLGNLRYVMRGLEFIGNRSAIMAEIGVGEPLDQAEAEVFGSVQSAQFFYYWADDKGLTDHGSSIPGWLSPRGAVMFAAIGEAIIELLEDEFRESRKEDFGE